MRMPDLQGRQRLAALAHLQHQIDCLERPALARAAPGDALTLGVPEIDDRLPWGGLAAACLHGIAAAASLTPAVGFAAVLLGRAAHQARPGGGTVLWCRRGQDLYAPGLAAFGLEPGNLIVVHAARDRDVLWVMEEGLRSGALAAVLGEPGRASPTALRRLQLAAETGGTPALLLGPEAHAGPAMTHSMTHWRIGAAESRPRAEAGAMAWPGPSRWRLELERCRGGVSGSWLVEWRKERRDGYANDNGASGGAAAAPGRLALAEPVRHGPDHAGREPARRAV